jgi:hypothetical protein
VLLDLIPELAPKAINVRKPGLQHERRRRWRAGAQLGAWSRHDHFRNRFSSMGTKARCRLRGRVGASLKPGLGQLPPTSFPTTDKWCDNRRNVPGFVRLHVEMSIMLIRDIRHT